MNTDYFPHDTTDEWWAENWHSLIDTHGYGDPKITSYYSFLGPTHTVAFLAPFTDLSRLVLVQVRPAPRQRPDPLVGALPTPLPIGWIGPGHPDYVPIERPTSQWKESR